jgi:hypothetical protein
MARPVIHLGQRIFCATREAGNPHSKYCDYLAWSSWRRRGAWLAPRIMLVCVTPASYRENVASISRAKCYLEHTRELIIRAGPKPRSRNSCETLPRKTRRALLLSGPGPVKISLTLQGQDFLGLVVSSVRGIPCQIWKRQFANVPTSSGSPMVNPRVRRTSTG